MNQFYRALHMPPKRLLRKVMGEKEIYTIAVRPRPTAEGTEPLPALEGGPYTLLPRREGWWFADPLLYHRRGMALQAHAPVGEAELVVGAEEERPTQFSLEGRDALTQSLSG